jgi:hypothetical protein
MTHENRNFFEISCIDLLDLLSAEGFSCSLDLRYHLNMQVPEVTQRKGCVCYQLPVTHADRVKSDTWFKMVRVTKKERPERRQIC